MATVHKLIEPIVSRFLNGTDDVQDLGRNIKYIIEEQSQNLPSQAAFSNLMTKLYGSGVDLLTSNDSKDATKTKIAGLTLFDCLLDVNDESEPQRRIEIAGHISKVLENDKVALAINAPIIQTAALSIGHFARIASTAEIEFLQNFFFPTAMKNIGDTRSESHRYSGVVILNQLAVNSPVLIFGKRRTVFNVLWDLVSDKSPSVRGAAAETLESSMRLVSQREGMSDYLRQAIKHIENGFSSNFNSSEKIIGSLIVLDIIIKGIVVSINELNNAIKAYGVQTFDLIWKVFCRKDSRDLEVREKVLEITPNLATAFSGTFLQPNKDVGADENLLNYSIRFITEFIMSKRDRQHAYLSLGKLFVAMSNHLRSPPIVADIFDTICSGFREPFFVEALQCLGMTVNASVAMRGYVDESLIAMLFRGGLTADLVEVLKIIIKHVPQTRAYVQQELRGQISSILKKYCVSIDGKKSRVPSRKGSVGAGTSGVVKEPKQHSKYYTSTVSLFTSNRQESTVSVAAVEKKAEEELLFAMEVLSAPEFFSTRQRQRQIAASRGRRISNVAAVVVDNEGGHLHLVEILVSAVAQYLDDFSAEVRGAAVQACAAVLDTIVHNLDQNSEEYYYLYQILDRLLMMGVGDYSEEIRLKVFTLLTPSLDHLISLTNNVHCLVEALNDESLEVQSAAMTVLARVAHYDTLHIMPVVRLTIKRLVLTLKTMSDYLIKQESVLLLQALVRGSDALIKPYVKEVMDPLLYLLNDPSPAVVIAALSTIGELAVASPENVRQHLPELSPRLIAALNDQSSLSKQELAVVAVGKLISSLTLVTEEPYRKFDGLFEGLVKAIQSTDEASTDLRLQAIKTLGLLGAVDFNLYHRHLTKQKGISGNFSSQVVEVEDEDAEVGEDEGDSAMASDVSNVSKLSKIDRYNFSVVIRELMKILRDPLLSSYHQSACSVAVKIVRIVGPQPCSQMRELVDGIIFRLYQHDTSKNLKDALLDHLISLIHATGRSLRPYLTTVIVKVVKDFFDSHLQLSLDIVESICLVFSTPDINCALREIIPLMMRAIDEDTSFNVNADLAEGDNVAVGLPAFQKMGSSSAASIVVPKGSLMPIPLMSTSATKRSSQASTSRPSRILQKFVNISESLGDYRRQLIPFIIQVLDCHSISVELKKEALCVMMYITNYSELQEFASKIIHPLLRMIERSLAEPVLLSASLSALSLMICRLGTGYIPFVIPAHRQLLRLREVNGFRSSKLDEYDALVSRLLKQRPLPPEPADMSDISVRVDPRVRMRANSAGVNAADHSFRVGIQSLESAWALAGRSNASDLVDWVRRMSIELIRQSPSPIIRSCAALAKTYRPLAEELFQASFSCIWAELFAANAVTSIVEDIPLINGIEMALQSPQIPLNITTALLNLAEFIELQDNRLPIVVRLFARQAQSANLYAKCLRYREREFSSKYAQPSIECIDALISVNNQLGSSDRAVGVLQYLRTKHPHIAIQPLWLEQLNRWEDARRAYEQQSLLWMDRDHSVGGEEDVAAGGSSTVAGTAPISAAAATAAAVAATALLLETAPSIPSAAVAVTATATTTIAAAAATAAAATTAPGLSTPNKDKWINCEIGKLRCLHAFGEYDELEESARKMMQTLKSVDMGEYDSENSLAEVQRLGANAAWMLGKWESMEEFVESGAEVEINASSSRDVVLERDTSFYKAILQIHNQEYDKAKDLIFEIRNALSSSISSLLSESYSRAYRAMVTAQMLAEMEEVVEYKQMVRKSTIEFETNMRNNNIEFEDSAAAQLPPSAMHPPGNSNSNSKGFEQVRLMARSDDKAAARDAVIASQPQTTDFTAKKEVLIRKWQARLKWAPKEVDVYRQILAVHTLVAAPNEDLDSWLEFVTLCRKERMFSLCANILRQLGSPIVSVIEPAPAFSSSSPSPVSAVAPPESIGAHPEAGSPAAAAGAISTGVVSGASIGEHSTKKESEFLSTAANHKVLYNTYKYLWAKGERSRALRELSNFLDATRSSVGLSSSGSKNSSNSSSSNTGGGGRGGGSGSGAVETRSKLAHTSQQTTKQSEAANEAKMFRVRGLLKRAEWMRDLKEQADVREILDTIMEARNLASDQYYVWHAWAVANYDQLKRTDTKDGSSAKASAVATSAERASGGGSGVGTPGVAVGAPVVSPSLNFHPSHALVQQAQTRTPIKSIQQGGASGTPSSGTSSGGGSAAAGAGGGVGTGAGTAGTAGTGPSTGSGPNPRYLSIATPRRGSASIVNLLSIQQVEAVSSYVIEGIRGFARSIVLGQGQPVANILQDTLQFLTLWFSYGTKKAVHKIVESELERISPENWLSVIPQLIARLHLKSPEISGLLRALLCKVAAAHPQALVCPISVALNTSDTVQQAVAGDVLHEMRKEWRTLVEEATLVSRELMRVAITPQELWYDGLEQAAQMYMDNDDIAGMVNVLNDLHEAMNDTSSSSSAAAREEGFSEGIGKIGTTTLRDIAFRHSYSRSLSEAQAWLEQFQKTGRTADLHQAWEIYQQLFKKMKTQISAFKKIELDHISPALTGAVDLSLAIPGTYRPARKDVTIKGFSHSVRVISSKQRPRRISMLGSNGKQYPFLLKGHEDLRQDERVMQLFGLINVCLDNDRSTNNRNLHIVRYSVLPLSNNSGVIGWVQDCDTINQLVKQYREAKNIRLLLEVKLQISKSLNYDKLPLLHKVEIFSAVQQETTGQDLARMLWLNSKSSDVWIERRDSFTKSLAVMSMVGYILGLGDRHPSNLMVERGSGRVVHIDFGDCFEITSQRSKFPEIIPFRLTRMLISCMEASGIEGTYRLTCERVMKVLRENRDSVMAMLEAFVYDPLISWRLLNTRNGSSGADNMDAFSQGDSDQDATALPGGGGSTMKDTSGAGAVGGGAGGGGGGGEGKLRTGLGGDHISSSLLHGGPIPMSELEGSNTAGGMSLVQNSFLVAGSRRDPRPTATAAMSIAAASVRDAALRKTTSIDPAADDELNQENVNTRALEIINRIQAKLTGRDFVKDEDDSDSDSDELTVEQQVDRLIEEATSVENLCQLFSGWCPLW